jgi:transcriptional regulator with XRE-family HTH domain
VTNIEAGRQPVQLHTIYRIAEILGVELASLLPARPDAVVGKKREKSLAENEFLRRIAPHGDKNAKITTRRDPTAGKQNTQGP